MYQDPIVAETRALRESYAAEHDHDLDAIFEDLMRRQAETTRKVVSRPPRKPGALRNIPASKRLAHSDKDAQPAHKRRAVRVVGARNRKRRRPQASTRKFPWRRETRLTMAP